MPPIKIVHFSDILCVWAYIGQSNLDQIAAKFSDRVTVDVHFCSVFPDTWTKISTQWKDRDGFEGYARHVQDVTGQFGNVKVHRDAWTKIRPRSSASPHLFIKAIELVEADNVDQSATTTYSERLSVMAAHELRSAFFDRAQDVSNWAIQREIAQRIGVDFARLADKIETGEAIAKLATDYDLAHSLRIEGSPTYVLNDGRQKLFGNVSYGVIEANVNELLTGPSGDTASLCG